MESEKVIDAEKIWKFWITESEDALRVADHLIEKKMTSPMLCSSVTWHWRNF
jgi:hypothetical protein